MTTYYVRTSEGHSGPSYESTHDGKAEAIAEARKSCAEGYINSQTAHVYDRDPKDCPPGEGRVASFVNRGGRAVKVNP